MLKYYSRDIQTGIQYPNRRIYETFNPFDITDIIIYAVYDGEDVEYNFRVEKNTEVRIKNTAHGISFIFFFAGK